MNLQENILRIKQLLGETIEDKEYEISDFQN